MSQYASGHILSVTGGSGSRPALRSDPVIELAGLLVLIQLAQVLGEIARRAQGVAVVVAQHPATQLQDPVEKGPGQSRFFRSFQVSSGTVEQPGDVFTGRVEVAAGDR